MKLYELLDRYIFTEATGEARKRNFMGISTDHASNMISRKKAGVTNRLQSELSRILVIYDLCHAFNLILKECIKSFPVKYINIVEDIASTFSQSPQKAFKLKSLLCIDGKETIKAIKRYVKVRWSSFQECLSRILQIKKALKQFFLSEGTDDQKEYFSEDNEMMLQLLLSVVNKVNYYIKYFPRGKLRCIGCCYEDERVCIKIH